MYYIKHESKFSTGKGGGVPNRGKWPWESAAGKAVKD